MYSLHVHDDADDDLELLARRSPAAAARILTLIAELERNQDLLDRLSQNGYGNYRLADFHVSTWEGQLKKGRNLWRLKVWDLEDMKLRYRIVYAFLPQRSAYHVLGIVPRSFGYESDHPLTRRILAAYADL